MIELHQGNNLELLPGILDRLAGRPINAIITDPPYGVAHVSAFAKVDTRNQRPIEGDDDPSAAIDSFLAVMDLVVPHLAEQADVYVFTSWKVIDLWVEACKTLSSSGLHYSNVLTWEKGWPGLGDLEANWAFSSEFILYLKKGRRPIRSRRPSVLAFDKPTPAQQIHPTEKPVDLLMELIQQSTDPGDLVLDPWAGSASLLDACRLVDRDAIGIELDAEFARRAHERLSQQTLSF